MTTSGEEQEHIGSYLQVYGTTELQKRIEFQRIHRLGKPISKSPSLSLARFLRYSDCQEVLELAQSKLKSTNYAVYEDIPKELYDLRKAQCLNLKRRREEVLKQFSAKLRPDRLYISGKYIPANDPFSLCCCLYLFE